VDPLSQGALGAAAALVCADRGHMRVAGVLGGLAGLAPDLDVLIQSPGDPLLFLEYHRQFTHSLAFIPVGAFVCALLLWPLHRRRLTLAREFLFCAAGYATHGLLDSCTSYGTQLFWPFSDFRVAWNNVSIIDPLFTLPLVGLGAFAAWKRRPALARTAAVWAVLYLVLGVVQRERAEAFGIEVARERGHAVASVEAKPAFGSLLVWKTIYVESGTYYVDAVRVGFGLRSFPGDRVEKLDLARDLPWLDPASQQGRDLERFRWFSSDSLALHPDPARRTGAAVEVIDVRYSLVPNRVDPLWGIRLQRAAADDAHVAFVTSRRISADARREALGMLFD